MMKLLLRHERGELGPKTIELSTDAGSTWAPLAKVAAGMDTGSLTVALPNTKTDQAKIRFSQDNDPTHIVDVSDLKFTPIQIFCAKLSQLQPFQWKLNISRNFGT